MVIYNPLLLGRPPVKLHWSLHLENYHSCNILEYMMEAFLMFREYEGIVAADYGPDANPICQSYPRRHVFTTSMKGVYISDEVGFPEQVVDG